MVLTRSQAKRLHSVARVASAQPPIIGYVIGQTQNGTHVLISIRSNADKTKSYNYLGGKFYRSQEFEVTNIEALEYSNKRMKYSQANVKYTGVIEHGLNKTDNYLLFYDRIIKG
jgi:D-Tyr-tRNAtyr deacylase